MIRFLAYLDRLINDKWLRGRFESISGRCFRRALKGCRLCHWLCRKLNAIDPNHCQKAHFSDRVTNPTLPD